jgi:hypothetical protein
LLSAANLIALSAVPFASANSRVLVVVFVAGWAVRLAPVGVVLSISVDAAGDRLKMRWSNAATVSALVVELQAVRDLALVVLIGDSVRGPLRVSWAYSMLAIAVGHERAFPFPAAVSFDADKALEACEFSAVEHGVIVATASVVVGSTRPYGYPPNLT